SAGSTELSTQRAGAYVITGLIDGWKEVKPNDGESYEDFKDRLTTNECGQYKNDDGTYTLVIKADLSNITNEEIAQAKGYASISDMVSGNLEQRGVDGNYASGLDDIYGNNNAINGRVMYLRFRFYQNYGITVVKDTDESNTATVSLDGNHGTPITKEVTATSTLIPYIGDANVSSTSAKIVKFDKKTNALLAGVQFKLQKLNGDTWEDYTANDGGDLVRTTDANGSIVFNDLNDGTYRFVEVMADEGYNIDSVLYGTDVNNVNDANLTFEVNSSDATGNTIYASNQEFSYNIDYQYVGDVPSDAVVPDSDTVDYGDQYVAKDATDVDGYTFDGWYTDSSLTTKFVDGTAITSDLILYGKYTHNKINVNYVLNGDIPEKAIVPSSDEIEYNSTYDSKDATIVEGYDFNGWYVDSSLTNKYVEGSILNEDLTLYGEYSIKKFTITTEVENGIIDKSINDIPYGSTIKINFCNNPGYEFNSIIIDGIKFDTTNKTQEELNKIISYTFEDIKANHNIKVIYSKIELPNNETNKDNNNNDNNNQKLDLNNTPKTGNDNLFISLVLLLITLASSCLYKLCKAKY
ncbi:MAG: InlB B-repeat-containing protein, partial [Bacilli bacterium]|nr:InlB B-repeat-containing protein [Bacilli bacterium]